MKFNKFKKLILVLLLSFSLIYSLSACNKEDPNCLAKVADKRIMIEDLEKALQYYKKVTGKFKNNKEESSESNDDSQEKELKKVKSTLLNQLVWDAIVEKDSETREINSQGLFNKLKRDAIKEMTDEDGLERQLQSLDLSMEEYEDSLRREALNLAHRVKVIEENEASDEDLKKYYNKHERERKLIDYEEAIVPSKNRAKDIEKEWQGKKSVYDPDGLNRDAFDETSYKEYKNMGIYDEQLVSEKLFKLNEGDSNYYYLNGLYHVIHVSKITEDFEIVKNHIRKLYESDCYLKYIKNKSKDYNVKIYQDFFRSK